jgi:conjugal transfer/entry exclusion protein
MVTRDESAFSQVKSVQRTYGRVASPAYFGSVTAPEDSELHDSTLESEIELLGEVLAAAARATEHLTQDQIDAALDAGRAPRRTANARAGQTTHQGASGRRPR